LVATAKARHWSTVLDIKERTSDRVVLEFDVGNQPKAARAVLNVEMSNMDLPNIEPSTVFSFEGNGLANAADYFNVQNAVATFSDEGAVCDPIIILGTRICVDELKPYAIDVTEAYRLSSDFLGLVLKAEGVSARYRIGADPTLSIVVPEPVTMPTALLGLLFAAGGSRRKCQVPLQKRR
jgi:hypothetical protein